jgi:amino acid efflux transporter
MTNFSRDLTIGQGVATIVTTLLGSGLFIVPAISASLTGGNALLAWVLLSGVLIPVAYVFGALGKVYPHVEGSAHFVRQAFGAGPGKFVGLLFISVIPIGPPVVVLTGASYAAALFGAGSVIAWGLAMIAGIFALNQLRFAVSSNLSAVIATVIAALIFAIGHAAVSQPSTIEYAPLDGGFLKAIGITFWCFVGIEAMSHISSEFRRERDFQWAMIFGVMFVGILYSLATYGVLKFGSFGGEQENLHSLLLIADQSMGAAGRVIFAVCGFFICLMAANLYIAASARLLHSYAGGRLPFNGHLLVITLLVAFTVVLKELGGIQIESLIAYANGVFVTIYGAVMLSGIRLLAGMSRLIAVAALSIMSGIVFVIGGEMLYVGVVLLLLGLASVLRRPARTT